MFPSQLQNRLKASGKLDGALLRFKKYLNECNFLSGKGKLLPNLYLPEKWWKSMTSLELAKEAAKYLNNKKAEEIKIVKIEDISSLTDYFVFATGTSNTHVNALADELEVGLKSVGIMPDHMEGYRANSWVLMDYNSVIVHIFTPESREFYDLDRLWQDGESIDMSFLN